MTSTEPWPWRALGSASARRLPQFPRRHVDCAGHVLHYQDAKTGQWTYVDFPDATLASFLVELTARRGLDAPVFPVLPVSGRPCKVVQKICRLASVPVVTCQQMRATVDTLGAFDLARVTGNRHSVGVATDDYIGRATLRSTRRVAASARLGSETGANCSQAEIDVAGAEDDRGSEGASS